MNDMKNKEFITIGKFNRLLDAYSVASKIESEGIECFLPNKKFTKLSHNHFIRTSEISLQVKKEDATKALQILNNKLFESFDEVSTGSINRVGS
jgi:hypothetical protein